MSKTITVEALVKKDIATVWESWTKPEHIMKWLFASDDWECPHAENDLRVGGKFLSRMSATDGSAGFDLTGVYTDVQDHVLIAYAMEDGRTVSVAFAAVPEEDGGGVHITETFEMENENSEELQRSGWQAILDNFKKYAEGR